MSENTPAILIEKCYFRYAGRSNSFGVKIDTLKIEKGERVALVGPSGSGKSTLLGLICGVLAPNGGKICVLGNDLGKMSGTQRDKFRAKSLGVIFQQFNLLPYLSVLDNVALAMEFSNDKKLNASEKQNRATQLINRLGLSDVVINKQKASQLSVGQQQRVAAARAFVGAPALIIADEPTSALDEDNQAEFLDLLFAQQQENGATLLLVTHDHHIAERFDRVINLEDFCEFSQAQAQQP